MGASLRLFLRLYLIFQTVFAFLWVSAFLWVYGGTSLAVVLGEFQQFTANHVRLVGGFILCPIVGAFMGAHIQIGAVRKLGVPVTAENLKTRQQRTITLDCPFEETFSLCLWSIRLLERAQVEEETDLGQGVILVTQDPAIREEGRRIRFDLNPAGESRTTVRIHSRSQFPCRPFLDRARNLRNILTIVAFLTCKTSSLSSHC